MTTKSHAYPSRVAVLLKGKKTWIVLDQIRTVDRGRLAKELGEIDTGSVAKVKKVIREMLVE